MRIIVGYDASDQAKDALALGRQLADAVGAELVVAGVFDSELAGQVAPAAVGAGAEARTVVNSSPARGLHELAEQIEADLIVVGSASHGRVGQVLAGSTGSALLHDSPCAVGVAPKGYRDRADTGFSTVVVGVDGSPEATEALTAAADLARRTNATLELVTVSPPPPVAYTAKGGDRNWHELKNAIDEQMRGRLAEARERVPEEVDVKCTFINGEPIEALAEVAEAPGTILVVGSRAYGPLRRVLLGSVSTGLVRSAPSPVLVTPRGIHDHVPVHVDAEVGQ